MYFCVIFLVYMNIPAYFIIQFIYSIFQNLYTPKYTRILSKIAENRRVPPPVSILFQLK